VRPFCFRFTVPLTYVGSLELFPTWYPGPDDDGVLALGNLDYLFDTAMTQMPYRVWLKTSGPVDEAWLADQVFEISLGVQGVMAAGPRVQAEQSRPERQGLLGLLSVGFGAAAFLAALGFVLDALFTFRRRSVELGVMRAMAVAAAGLCPVRGDLFAGADRAGALADADAAV
jgi:putative ABC transport system permease protein